MNFQDDWNMKYELFNVSFMKKSLLAFLLILLSLESVAQTNDCLDKIKALLPDGVYEYGQRQLTEETFHSVLSWYEMHSSDTYNESQKRSANLTVPIDDVLVGLGLSKSDSSYNQFIQHISSYYSQYDDFKLSLQETWKRINVNAIKALENCLGAAPGIRGIKVLTGNPKTFIVRFFYNDDYKGAPDIATVILSYHSKNITVPQTVVGKLKLRNGFIKDILISRMSNDAGTVIFESNAKPADGKPLTFNFVAIKQNSTGIKLDIDDGQLTENATVNSTYITLPPGTTHNSPQPLSQFTAEEIGPNIGTAEYGTVAKATTKAQLNKTASNNQLLWQLTINNHVLARCGGSGGAASASVKPFYVSTLHLPALSQRNKLYNLTLHGDITTLFPSYNGTTVVSIAGKGKTIQYDFSLTNNTVKKYTLPSGDYRVTIQVASMQVGCGGEVDGTKPEFDFTNLITIDTSR